MINRQTQECGDNSTNVQAQNIYIQHGIDEKRAREIYQEMNLQLRKEYSREALEIANARVSEFENALMPKMESVEGALGAFADPSFQLLLLEAQKTAAATERPADYDLLSELLIHRFKKGDSRNIRAGINRAVEIVDEISDEALLGLTTFHAVGNFLPLTGDITQGLDVLDRLFGAIIYSDLPTGREWLDHLDILDAVRLSSFGSLKKIERYFPESLSGYIDAGIRKNTEEFDKAVEIIKSNGLPMDTLIDHELNPLFVRIPIANKTNLGSITITVAISEGDLSVYRRQELTAKQKEAIYEIYELYDKSPNIRDENSRVFMQHWDNRENLNKLKVWWNSLDLLIEITSVGKVLAHSNAKRCDKSLPNLD